MQTEWTPEEHSHIITDVRFRPNTTQLATSSFDTCIRLWEAIEVNFLSPLLPKGTHLFLCPYKLHLVPMTCRPK